jgi:hypothetical protein
MSINIQRAQAAVLAEGFDFGGDDRSSFGPVQLTIIEKLLFEYGEAFKLELEAQMKQQKVTASGALADGINPQLEDGNKLVIRMLDYYDYPNKGVKGVKSSRNAPGSPYQYRNFGMNKQGRDSIREYIRSGRAKVASVKRDAARGIGLERKGVDLETAKVNTLIYLIKAYGIKKTSYYDKAFEKVFGTLQQALADGIGYQITLTIDSINKMKTKK